MAHNWFMVHKQEENLNNGHNPDLFSFFFAFEILGGGGGGVANRDLILEHFWYNSEHLRYI